MQEILCSDGQCFNLAEPEQSAHVVNLLDIGHSLSNICRFTGKCREFYSVAQHSVLCYQVAQEMYPGVFSLHKYALLHDAAEAYTNDITTQMKLLLPDFRALESRVEAVVFRKLGLPEVLPFQIKIIDRILLATEKRDIMPYTDKVWPILEGITPRERKIRPWEPVAARHAFYVACKELGLELSDQKCP